MHRNIGSFLFLVGVGMVRTRWTRNGVVGMSAVCLGFVLFAVACKDIVQENSIVEVPKHSALTQDALVAKISESNKRVGWVGDFHRDAIDEFLAERKQWKTSDKAEKKRLSCKSALRIAEKHMRRAQAKVAHPLSERALKQNLHTIAVHYGCGELDQNVFVAAGSIRLPIQAALAVEYAAETSSYMNDIQSAVQSGQGDPVTTDNLISNVITSASWLPAENFDGVIALADLVVSSWGSAYEYQQSGGWGEEQIYVIQNVFRGYAYWPGTMARFARCNDRCWTVVAGDAAGFIFGSEGFNWVTAIGGGIVGSIMAYT